MTSSTQLYCTNFHHLFSHILKKQSKISLKFFISWRQMLVNVKVLFVILDSKNMKRSMDQQLMWIKTYKHWYLMCLIMKMIPFWMSGGSSKKKCKNYQATDGAFQLQLSGKRYSWNLVFLNILTNTNGTTFCFDIWLQVSLKLLLKPCCLYF